MDRDSDLEYNRRYQKFEDDKNKMIQDGLAHVDNMKKNVKETGQMID